MEQNIQPESRWSTPENPTCEGQALSLTRNAYLHRTTAARDYSASQPGLPVGVYSPRYYLSCHCLRGDGLCVSESVNKPASLARRNAAKVLCNGCIQGTDPGPREGIWTVAISAVYTVPVAAQQRWVTTR